MRTRVLCMVLLCGGLGWSCGGESPSKGGSDPGCETGDACANDSDCGSGARCNRKACTRLYCLSDGSSCDSDALCESQSCIRGATDKVCWSGPVAEGWPCDAHACKDGLFCRDGRCQKGGSLGINDTCTTAEECMTGLLCRRVVCTETAKVCTGLSGVDGPCCTDADCENFSCLTGYCRTPAVFSFTPESFTFTLVQGQPNPPAQNLTVTNSGGAPLTFSAHPPGFDNYPLFTVDPTGTQTVPGGQSLSVAIAPDQSFEGSTFTVTSAEAVLELHTTELAGGVVNIPIHFQLTVP